MTTGRRTTAALLAAGLLLGACGGGSGNAYRGRLDWGCRVESGKTVCPARTEVHRIDAAAPGRPQ